MTQIRRNLDKEWRISVLVRQPKNEKCMSCRRLKLWRATAKETAADSGLTFMQWLVALVCVKVRPVWLRLPPSTVLLGQHCWRRTSAVCCSPTRAVKLSQMLAVDVQQTWAVSLCFWHFCPSEWSQNSTTRYAIASAVFSRRQPRYSAYAVVQNSESVVCNVGSETRAWCQQRAIIRHKSVPRISGAGTNFKVGEGAHVRRN